MCTSRFKFRLPISLGESYRLREKRRAGLVGRVGELERKRDGRGSAIEAEGG